MLNKKSLNVRMPLEMNMYLRKQALELEISLNQLIVNCLSKWMDDRKKMFPMKNSVDM